MSENDDLPAFFIDQRLDLSADERSIKRAYAKALKQIDQENDLNGFQDLRESYEYALAWARHRDWRAQQELENAAENPAAEETNSEASLPSIEAGSQATTNFNLEVQATAANGVSAAPVYLELSPEKSPQVAAEHTIDKNESAPAPNDVSVSDVAVDTAAVDTAAVDTAAVDTAAVDTAPVAADLDIGNQGTVAVGPAIDADLPQPVDLARAVYEEFLQGIREKNDDRADLESTLRLAMDDDRLINVEARDVFEWMLASYVAQGWQPGNGNLFGATVKCFQWNQDRNRLLRFGELGYYLDHALVEMSSFNEQERMLADRQVFLIRRARDSTMPDKAFFKENIAYIHHMGSSFPNWLSLVTSWTNLQAWRERAAELKIEPKPPKKKDDDESSLFSNPQLWFFLAIIFINVIRGCGPDTKKYSLDNNVDMKAVAEGHTKVTQLLGPDHLLYQMGEDAFFGRDRIQQNYKAAETSWLKCAENEHLDCIARLADLYSMSQTGLEDPSLAHKYREQAAERGKTRMYFELANDYILGRGVKKDEAKALLWTQKAVDIGEPAAVHNLAYLYERGIGVKKNPKLAWENYLKAAAQGLPIAMRTVGMIYLTGQLRVPKDEQAGLQYLMKSAEKNYGQAEYDLGTIYEKGLYKQSKDVELAVQWFGKAAKHKHDEASKKLDALCKSDKLYRSSACSLKSS